MAELDREFAIARLRDMEAEERAAAEKERKASAMSETAVQFLLGRADAFATARDIVQGVVY